MKFAVYAMPSYDKSFGLTQGEFLRKTVDQYVSAEALGYDSIWVNEHHYHSYGGLLPSLPTILGALSQCTSKVRLGTSVVVLPLHHPLDIAEQMAMVDLLSNGRLDLGIGRGFVEHDYQVLGVDYSDAQERLKEGINIVRRAWSGETFSYEGKYWNVDNVQVWPLPEQQPHPPIWRAVAGNHASIDYAAAEGFSVVTTGHSRPPEKSATLAQHYRDAWQAAGHKAPANLAVHYHCVIAEDRAEAFRIADAGLHQHNRLNHETRMLSKAVATPQPEHPPVAQLVEDARTLCGTPEDVVALLQRISDATGLTEAHMLFQFGSVTFDQAQRSLELFAREVMPKFAAAQATAS
jgi:alkanesulfonate monooxygenase SsuD/methylene tetrahydromethanopterin reductase-like flavin-dependent oxidoreductase (luciferase family)